MVLAAGKLNRRIHIQTQSDMQDDFGQPRQSWSNAYSCWASIDVQQSQLLYSTSEFMSKTTIRITCRWTSSFIFTSGQRVVYIEPTTQVVHTYEIQAIINDQQANRALILMCYELGAKE